MKLFTIKKQFVRTTSFFILFLIFVSLFGFFAYRGLAQTLESTQTLEVSPASQEVKGDPGTTVQIKSVVRNKGNKTIPVQVRIEDFTASGDEGQVALIEKSDYAVSTWTKVTPNSFTLDPSQSQEVQAQVQIPKEAAGGRYGSFVFSVAPPKGTENAAGVSQEIASLFLLNIGGPVKEELSIASFTAPQFSEFGPIDLTLKFKNSGNIHVAPVGIINVSDAFHRKTADIVMKPTNVFPGAERTVVSTLDKKFLIGPYTATAIVYYGSNNESLTSTTTFFVFPLRIATIILVIAVILFLMRKRIRKALKVLMG